MSSVSVDNDVIHHLLFHKSLIDEQDDASRINYYVDLLQKTHEGDHISINNPFDRSITIAFELVMQQHLNPWDIDLVSFSTMYLNRAKQEAIDLITAGRIIHMAWKILRLQSSDLIVSLQQEETDPEDGIDWDDLPTALWLSDDDAYSYTNLLMDLPEPPLQEPIRRDVKRKVTLMELLDAFGQAKKDAEEYQLMEKRRREEQRLRKEASRRRMKGTAHEDNLEEDIAEVWERISSMDKTQMTLGDLCPTRQRDEVIKTLISILFLAYENKIKVYQQKFPYGKIFIRNKTT
jgi:segregation and condensation protein A